MEQTVVYTNSSEEKPERVCKIGVQTDIDGICKEYFISFN
jgi:hypothetical protein